MPRSKLGLALSVQKLCQKAGHNPTVELIKALSEKDEKGKYVAAVKDRITGNIALMNRMAQSAPVKSREVVAEQERNIQIVRQTYTLPEPANGTIIKDVNADEGNPSV